MHRLASMLMALALATLLTTGALAQSGNDQQQDEVTVSFELQVNGEVPDDRAFAILYGTREDLSADRYTVVGYCAKGDPSQLPTDVLVSDAPCTGSGKVYRYADQFPTGTQLLFSYQVCQPSAGVQSCREFHGSEDDDEDVEDSDFATLSADTTISAYYSFERSGRTPSQMPATGAGGQGSGTIPEQPVAVGMLLLAGCAWAVRRWRPAIGR